LHSWGVKTSRNLRHHRQSAHLIANGYSSVKRAIRETPPYLSKKATEAAAALDYHDRRATVNDLVEAFRAEVEAGRRERRSRSAAIDCPFTRV